MNQEIKDNRAKKELRVEKLHKLFEESKHSVFVDYRGVSVSEMTDLRSRLSEQSAVFRVVKNNFCKIALDKLEYQPPSDMLAGPTAVAFFAGDPSGGIKELVKFGKDSTLSVKGAYVDGGKLAADELVRISELPSREVLLAMLMNAMNGNATNIVGVLQAVPRSLVNVLKAVQDKKE